MQPTRYRPVAEVAAELGVTVQTLKRRIKDCGLSPCRLSRDIGLSDDDVVVVLEHSRRRGQRHPGRLPNYKAMLHQYRPDIEIALFSLEAAAGKLGISVPALRHRIQESRIRPVRLGRAPMLTKADIERLIEDSRFHQTVTERQREAEEQRLRERAEARRRRDAEKERVRQLTRGLVRSIKL